jgi:hypothetical protein
MFKTDRAVIDLIRVLILVSVNKTQQIFVSYYENMLPSQDTSNIMNVTIPDHIHICGWKLILQSFTEFMLGGYYAPK